ncbi:unnamed protein product [Paramecium primaurelia]|uniref:Uncharacterized protein n=1 Tax=Paramecium primaurelia TaxID=5886 RepID=A0A8S1MG04_PARPR|nr:unnamed protein product [Paramecium primaurelia]
MIIFIITIKAHQFSSAKKIISKLKEVGLLQKTPLFEFFNKTLGRVIQIRLYHQQDWFRIQFLEVSNKCNHCALTYYNSFWFNLDVLGLINLSVGILIFQKLNYDNIARIINIICIQWLTTFGIKTVNN